MKKISFLLISVLFLNACNSVAPTEKSDVSTTPEASTTTISDVLVEKNITLGSFVFLAPDGWSEIKTSKEGDQLLLTAKVPDSQYNVVLNVRIKPTTNPDYFYDTILKGQESPDFVTDGGQKIYVSGCGGAMCLAFADDGVVYDLDSWFTSSQEVPADQDGPFAYDTDMNSADIKVFLKTMRSK